MKLKTVGQLAVAMLFIAVNYTAIAQPEVGNGVGFIFSNHEHLC